MPDGWRLTSIKLLTAYIGGASGKMLWGETRKGAISHIRRARLATETPASKPPVTIEHEKMRQLFEQFSIVRGDAKKDIAREIMRELSITAARS